MRILIMNRKYGGVFGGVEYMSTALALAMVERGHEVALVSLDHEADASFMYDVPETVIWFKVASEDPAQKASWGERYSRNQKIRQVMKDWQPDVAVGFQDGAYLSLLLASVGLGVPVIAAERNSPGRFRYIKEGKIKYLRYLSFFFASALTIQCPRFKDQYPWFLHPKIETIPNPIFPVKGKADPKGAAGERHILLHVGRYSFQKNQQLLIQAFAQIAGHFPEWDLHLVGDGEDRATLETLVETLPCRAQIKLVGYKKDPAEAYKGAQLFALPSRWEGFPNALAEAMSYGLPSVGLASCDGVSDLIKNGETGLLADEAGLSAALATLMGDSKMRESYGKLALEAVKSYSPATIYGAWESLFEKVSVR
ncbi:MAG: glycosyltransferase [Pseudobdellovibrionaceae bacterium]